ncbi:uncharacterized protein LOC126553111 [Aphis gossypii]|uniref:uncharacterized protein LOC126553111 n=1 Tax=Aphis gossypii TaxID=80765 RepID=UPI0021594FE4|nr:uncharacterized protein LOC126553111 [Aphis gossypii]
MWISRWPKIGNVRSMISEYADTENDWPKYPVKIVSQFYNTYDDAAIKEKEIFLSASASETEYDGDYRNNSYKKQKTLCNIAQDGNDSSNSSTSSTPVSPINIKTAIKKKNSYENLNVESTKTNTEKFYQTISNAISGCYELQEEQCHVDNLTYPSPRSTPPPNVQQNGTHLPAFFNLIPIKTVEGLDEIENKIKADSDFEKKVASTYIYFLLI